jgi:hypothetical protein
MERYDFENLRKNYKSIFADDELKARAFDKVAENYFLGNFGTMQKSDFEVLLFSIYIEAILDKSEADINSYSDYTLAKQLGIPQSKVSTLKVKKQLQYPYEGFDWKQSFLRVADKARYEGGKIRINLRDRNLYYELKNWIDEQGSYVDTSLTTNLLIVSPTDFLNLIGQLMSDKEKKAFQETFRKNYNNEAKLCGDIEKAPLGETLANTFKSSFVDVVLEIVKSISPALVGKGIEVLQETFKKIKEKQQ